MSALGMLESRAVIVDLVNRMRIAGSWAGETHIQKCTFFLQELFGLPTPFEFVLYKHGPYSFDLHDELTAMRGNLVLSLEPRYPYGPSFTAGPNQEGATKPFSKTVHCYENQLEFIANNLATRDVSDMERLATALYVTIEQPSMESSELAKTITELKPHISLELAVLSLNEVKELKASAKQEGLEVRS